jgi:hypothetical protein
MIPKFLCVANVAPYRCRETSIILKIDAPRVAAEVKNPARRLIAPNELHARDADDGVPAAA